MHRRTEITAQTMATQIPTATAMQILVPDENELLPLELELLHWSEITVASQWDISQAATHTQPSDPVQYVVEPAVPVLL
ncbi:hypothetical protein BBJ28_00001020 [Nothophytophthora sp. Chile5]|nr:hypothetical protein BBJ28_00001020 [Nothophytophthora sp. Chile5]